MKLARLTLIAGAVTLISSAQAVTLAVWNFNDSVSGGATDLNVDRQLSGVNATLTTTFDTNYVTNFAGTTVGADSGDAAGQALALQGGLNTSNNGKTVVIAFNASGYDTLALSYASRNTSTGFNLQTIAVSTDGVNYSNVGTVNDLTTTFALKSFSIAGLDNASTAFIKYTFTGATGETGNNRLDNIVISGSESVPEPTSMALLGLGLAGFVARKRKNA